MWGMRVLAVDDSVLVRRELARVLSRDPEIEQVDTAPNWRIALAKIALRAPDLITLDVEMSQMNGLEVLSALRKTHPLLPVIMFSAFTSPDASATLNAGLTLAAVDYVRKPPRGAHEEATSKVIREDLLPKIKLHLSTKVAAQPSLSRIVPMRIPDASHAQVVRVVSRVDIVVIGVSTGGPKALAELLPSFPRDFPVPILIVQHMPPEFTDLLAEELSSRSKLEVEEATSVHVLEPGHVWLAQGDSHMVVEKTAGIARIRLHKGPRENSCRPSVDVLFRSAVEVYGPGVLAILMTGMGRDGFEGCKVVRETGGQILVQDEASSVVWGMPGFVTQAGFVDEVLPLSELGPHIIERVMAFRASESSTNPKSIHR